MNTCPKKAIETGHGFIVAIYMVFLAVMPFIYINFEKIFFKLESEIWQFLLETGILLMIVAVLYRVLHFGMRFKVVERMMVYTSFTRLWFWRRYKALKP
jgi:small-conductance mechanosensitive channel